jgi:hypothetical protein
VSDIRSAAVPSLDEAPASAGPAYREPIGSRHSLPPRAFQVLRWLLLAVVVLCLLAWVLLTPRRADPTKFVDDLQKRRIVGYSVGLSEDYDRFRGLRLDGSRDGTQVVAWCTGRLDCHQVSLDQLAIFVEPDSEVDGVPTDELDSEVDGVPTDELDEFGGDADVVQRLISRYSPDARPKFRQPNEWLNPLAVAWPLAWLTMVFVLISGPQPRRATKWAMFWWLCLPGGLGMLWALTREAPWSRRAAALPEPPPGPGEGKYTGGWAFIGLAFLSGLLIELPAMVQSALP